MANIDISNTLVTGIVRDAGVPVTYIVGDIQPLPLDISGNLITGNPGISMQGEYASPDDFTAVYLSASTLTITLGTNTPTPVKEQFLAVVIYRADNTAKRHAVGIDGISFGYAGGVLTIYKNGSVISAATDIFISSASETYRVEFRAQRKAYSQSTASTQVSDINPIWSRKVGPIQIVSVAQNVTTSWADLPTAGSEIDTAGYNWMGLWFNVDINDSTNIRLRALVNHTAAGSSFNFPLEVVSATDIKVIGATVGAVQTSEYLELDQDADQLVFLKIALNNIIPFIRLQVCAEVVGATAGQIDNLHYTLGY